MTGRPRIDYDQLAGHYDARYEVRALEGIAAALRDLVAGRELQKILEIGCGTGRWLEEIGSRVGLVCGVDSSLGMLRKAAKRATSALLVAARANNVPLAPNSFDVIFCVNALHHFDDPHEFIGEAKRLLTTHGTLAIIGIDPRLIKNWYLYEYFERSYERDLCRYPSAGDIVNWMAAAGFGAIEYRVVEMTNMSTVGRGVLADAFLKKESNSMLALLSDEEYEAGLRRIEAALECADAEGRQIEFAAELPFLMIKAGEISEGGP